MNTNKAAAKNSIDRIELIKASKPFKIMDLIFVSVLLIVTVFMVIFSYQEQGESVLITYNGKTTEYDLNKDARIDIDSCMIVVIKNGEVYVEHADCPDKVCERSGKIKKVSQSIICVPNGVFIRISGKRLMWTTGG